MKMTMTENRFIDALIAYDYDWSYEQARILYEYYDEQETNSGVEKEFNAHDIGLEWSVSKPLDLWNDYSNARGDNEPYSLNSFEAWLSSKTVFYWLENGDVLYQSEF